MIILWSESDMGIRDYDPDWLDETIERVEHKRDAMLSRVKTTVRNYDDHVGVGVYNHYVCQSLINSLNSHAQN